jgi:putative transposase
LNTKEIIKQLHQTIIEDDLNVYRQLYKDTDLNEATDPYWKEALKFYSLLTREHKEVLFKIIEQVEVDTLSSILGVLDNGIVIEEEEVEFKLTMNGDNEQVNGDLHEQFLMYDEEIR